MSSNVYSVGLRNVGSYQVSGAPYVKRQSVNAEEEVKIELPYVAKNIKIRIPSPPNNATNVDCGAGGAYWWSYQTNSSFAQQGNLPSFGGGTSSGVRDYTYSLWFKGTPDSTTDMLLAMLGPSPLGYRLIMAAGTGTFANIKVYMWDAADVASAHPNSLNTATYNTGDLAVNDMRTNWNNLIITQQTGSTHFYVNGAFATKRTGGQLLESNNIMKGFNSSGKTASIFSYDEEIIFNTGMNHNQILELYNNGEYFNPNYSSLKDNLVGWWTWGDDSDGKYAPGLVHVSPPAAGSDYFNVFLNQATGNSASGSAKIGWFRGNPPSPDDLTYVPGPFTKQSTGKIRISPVRNLIGGMNFPDTNSNGSVDNQFNIPFTAERSNNSFTLAFWFKPQAGISGVSVFLAGTGLVGNAIRYVPQAPAGVIKFRLGAFGLIVDKLVSNVTDDVWHHFALVIDKDSNFLSIYINGQLEISGAITAYYDITNWAIPINGSSDVQNYAEYTIFGSALNANQVGDLYNGGYPRDPTGLSFASSLENWYRFSEELSPADTTTTILDRVGNNDATVGGSPNNANFIAGPKSSVDHNKHYYELQGYGSSIDLPMKTKEVYISGVDSQTTIEVTAELTNIPTERMYELSGSGINE